MAQNSRNEHSRDRQSDRGQESDRSRNENRRNTSGNQMENHNTLERGSEREDRISTVVPDNYERDSE